MNRKLSQVNRKLATIADERAISPQDLKLLAEPTREFIFNALVPEPRTATELGELLGCPTTRLYHHLKLLEKHGLIMVVAQRLVSGIVERRYRAVAQRLRLDRSAFGAELPGCERLQTVLDYVFDTARNDIARGAMYAGYFDASIAAGNVVVHGGSLAFCSQPLDGLMTFGSSSYGCVRVHSVASVVPGTIDDHV